MLQERVDRTRALLRAHGVDALVITQLANVRYLCGFTGSDGVLLITADELCFLSDSRYASQAAAQVQSDRCSVYSVKVDGVVEALKSAGVRRAGFEAEHLSFAEVIRLREKSGELIEWVPLGRELFALRAVKCLDEVVLLEAAAQLAADAFNETLPLLRPGVIEREFAMALEFALRRHGGDELAFEIIVASGERGALPHGIASERRFGQGELVTIDYGVRYRGYCSDETITLALGSVPDELHQLHDIVYLAQHRALEMVRPGASLRDVDAAARDYIAARGYGECFGHGLGHGLGLEVHEYPSLSPRTDVIAMEGMVFTVEPGIYVPGLGGVRIEDTVVVTAGGCRKLTKLAKEFRRIAA